MLVKSLDIPVLGFSRCLASSKEVERPRENSSGKYFLRGRCVQGLNIWKEMYCKEIFMWEESIL